MKTLFVSLVAVLISLGAFASYAAADPATPDLSAGATPPAMAAEGYPVAIHAGSCTGAVG